jgi:hypothetical protein
MMLTRACPPALQALHALNVHVVLGERVDQASLLPCSFFQIRVRHPGAADGEDDDQEGDPC